jgi:hypothetical protein
MRRGIPGRHSRAAGWARFFGALALPVLVLAVIGSWIGIVPNFALESVIITGFVLGVLALALGAYSLANIWNTGADGLGVAIAGIVYASPALVLLAAVAAAAIVYPPLNDVSTDPSDPPRLARVSTAAPDVDRAVQPTAYSNLKPHRYPLPLGQVHAAALDVIKDKGWLVTHDEHPPFMPMTLPGATPAAEVPEDPAVVGPLALKKTMTQSRSGIATESAPDSDLDQLISEDPVRPVDEATIEARAETPRFGFLDDVAIRLRVTDEGTQVDMRSTSERGQHDLGHNARRIVSFLAALDAKLQPEPAGGAASQ